MNIVLSSSYPYVNETGAARVAKLLACELGKTNSVLFICLGDAFKVKSVDGIQVCTLPSYSIGVAKSPKLSKSITDKLESLLETFNPDIIHAQNILSNELLIIAWAVRRQVPLTITFHQLPSEAIGHISPKLKVSSVGKLLQYVYSNAYTKKILQRTDSVIALNSFVESSIREIDKDIPIAVINNGIDLKDFLEIPIKSPSKKVICTFLGSYFPRKNQLFLIEMMRYLPKSFELHLYGNKKSGKLYVNKLEKKIKELEIKNVFVHDFISRKQVLKCYEKTDLFVSASLQEAQSLVIIEALGSGTPVIGLANETIDELIDKTIGLRIKANSTPQQFADELLYFWNHIEYKTVALNAKKKAQKFDVTKVAPLVLKQYKKTINLHTTKSSSTYNSLFDEFIPENIDKLLQKYQRNKLNGLVRFTVVISRVGETVSELVQAAKELEK